MRHFLLSVVACFSVATALAATPPADEDFESQAINYDIANEGDWTSTTGGTATVVAAPASLASYLGGGGTAPLSGGHAQVLSVEEDAVLTVAGTADHEVVAEMLVQVVRSGVQPTGAPGDQLAVYVDDLSGKVNVWYDNGGSAWYELTSSPVIADLEWVHLVVTANYDGNRYKVSVNGSEISDANGYSTAKGATQPGPWLNMVQTNNVIAEIEIATSAAAPTYLDELVVSTSRVVDVSAVNPNLSGDGNDDVFEIVRVGPNFRISVGGQVATFVGAAESVTIQGSTDTDVFNFDLAGGVMPQFTVAGGGGGGVDSMNFTDVDGNTLTYSVVNVTDGSVALDGNTLTFTGLEPTEVNGTVTNVIINDNTGAAQSIVVSSVTAGTQTRVEATGATFERIDFTNPTGSLIINAGSGNDDVSVTQTALAALGNIFIEFNGDAGTDVLNVDLEGSSAVDTGTQIIGTGWVLNYNDFNAPTLANLILAVPALGEWGIILLSLTLLVFGLRRLPSASEIIVAREALSRALPAAVLIVAVGYAVMLAVGSSVAAADLFGIPVATALLAYVVAFCAEHRDANAAQANRVA
ncbi:MAG TPA: hypothetical protein DCR55_07925 [Lentisphaeria bacterium]|nr:hypothetical protein [Lentisphaeria bacterium]